MVWWHPGRDFVVAPFIGRKIGEDQRKKKFSMQYELAFGPKVCDDKKKKVFDYQSVGFRSQKKTKKKQNGDTRGGPPTPPLLRCHYF